mgnify:FL=1
MLEKVENLSAYEVKDRRFVEEMNSEGMVLEHRKSGARLFLMSNEDDNKVFQSASEHRLRTAPDCLISWSTAYWKVLKSFR